MNDKVKLTGILSQGYGINPKSIMRAKFDPLLDKIYKENKIYEKKPIEFGKKEMIDVIKSGKGKGKHIKIVLSYMLSFCGNGVTECFPEINDIASELEMARNHVIEAIQNMELLGILKKEKKYGEKSQVKNNIYTILILSDIFFESLDNKLSEFRQGILKVQTKDSLSNNNKFNNNSTNKSNKVSPENSGDSIFKNNSPEKLTKVSNKILHIVKKAFSAVAFTNVLPEDGAETCNTKTYQEIQDFIYNLHELKLRSAYEWDSKWLDRNHIDFKSLREKAIGTNGSSRLPFEEIERLVEKALKNYKKMYQEEYWPEKKETLTLNFKHFLYNFNTKKSWFLYCLFNDPVELPDKNAENIIKDLPGDVIKLIKNFGEGDIAESWSKYAFYSKMRDLYTWYEPRIKQFKKYHDLLKMGGFWSKLGSFQDLIDTIFEYILTWRDDWTVNHFGRNCKTWNLFVKWVEKEFGFDLDLDDDDLQKAEKDYDALHPEKAVVIKN